MKNPVSEINSMLNEAEDWIGDLENKVAEKHPIREAKRKKLKIKIV